EERDVGDLLDVLLPVLVDEDGAAVQVGAPSRQRQDAELDDVLHVLDLPLVVELHDDGGCPALLVRVLSDVLFPATARATELAVVHALLLAHLADGMLAQRSERRSSLRSLLVPERLWPFLA